MTLFLEPLTLALMCLALILTAAHSQLGFSRGTSSRPLSIAVLLSWIGTVACAGICAIVLWRCGVWRPRGEFRSPDGRTIAHVEEQTSWDADVVKGYWDRTSVTFTWNPDSKGGALRAAGRELVTIP